MRLIFIIFINKGIPFHVIHPVIPCIILHFAYVGYIPEIRQILFFDFFFFLFPFSSYFKTSLLLFFTIFCHIIQVTCWLFQYHIVEVLILLIRRALSFFSDPFQYKGEVRDKILSLLQMYYVPVQTIVSPYDAKCVTPLIYPTTDFDFLFWVIVSFDLSFYFFYFLKPSHNLFVNGIVPSL